MIEGKKSFSAMSVEELYEINGGCGNGQCQCGDTCDCGVIRVEKTHEEKIKEEKGNTNVGINTTGEVKQDEKGDFQGGGNVNGTITISTGKKETEVKETTSYTTSYCPDTNCSVPQPTMTGGPTGSSGSGNK